MKPDIRDFTFSELAQEFEKLNLPPFRARQVFSWLHKKGAREWDEMTDISKKLRERLAEEYRMGTIKLKNRAGSASRGAVKHLFELADGAMIESVWLKDGNRRTVCVSTQVGCALGCRICRTAQMGLQRNLRPAEIAGQVLGVQRGQSEPVTNVVFMGMGEPFLNYQASLKAARILNHDLGLNIGARKITISTAGVVDGITKMAHEPEQFKLAVSLNAADQKTRERLMPVAAKYPLKELIPAVKGFIEIKGKRVTFEYVLVRGVNDGRKDAKNLEMLLAGIECKINLIPLNPYPGCEFQAPTPDQVKRFAGWIMPNLPAVTVRKSLGSEILAGCGQLVSPHSAVTHRRGDPDQPQKVTE